MARSNHSSPQTILLHPSSPTAQTPGSFQTSMTGSPGSTTPSSIGVKAMKHCSGGRLPDCLYWVGQDLIDHRGADGSTTFQLGFNISLKQVHHVNSSFNGQTNIFLFTMNKPRQQQLWVARSKPALDLACVLPQIGHLANCGPAQFAKETGQKRAVYLLLPLLSMSSCCKWQGPWLASALSWFLYCDHNPGKSWALLPNDANCAQAHCSNAVFCVLQLSSHGFT